MLEKVWYFVLFSVEQASQRVMEQKGEILGEPSIGRGGRSRSDSTLGGAGVLELLLAGESPRVLYPIYLVTSDRETGSERSRWLLRVTDIKKGQEPGRIPQGGRGKGEEGATRSHSLRDSGVPGCHHRWVPAPSPTHSDNILLDQSQCESMSPQGGSSETGWLDNSSEPPSPSGPEWDITTIPVISLLGRKEVIFSQEGTPLAWPVMSWG